MRAVDRLVLNASRVIGVLRDFSAPDPMDVTIDWLNDDGTLTSHTFANIAKSHIANDDHNSSTDNPHGVTKDQVGLSNVDNTSDADKPISTAMQSALDNKASASHNHDNDYEPKNSNIQSHISDTTDNPHNVTKADVGLSNVDNTSDADKPISTETQNVLDMKSDIGHDHNGLYHPKEGDINLNLNAKEILAVTGENAVQLLNNEMRLYAKKGTDDEVHCLLNMYDNGGAFDQGIRDKNYNYISNKLRVSASHKAYVIDMLGGEASNQIPIVDHNGRITNQNPTLGDVNRGNQRFGSVMNRTPYIDTYHDVAEIYRGGTITDRALQIKFPEAMRDEFIMMKVKLEGFEYGNQSSWAATISGYNYGDHDRWHAKSVELSGNPPFKTVRLSHDTSDDKRRCIVLGGTNTTWKYAAIKISIQVSYSGRQHVDFAEGWDYAFIENMDNIKDDAYNKDIPFPLNAYTRPLTLQNNWENYGSYYATAKFSVNHGIVNLMGVIKNGDAHSVVATLPEWGRPKGRRMFSIQTKDGAKRLDVRSNGEILMYGDHEWISLDNVSFSIA
jgi:hypothetical protein